MFKKHCFIFLFYQFIFNPSCESQMGIHKVEPAQPVFILENKLKLKNILFPGGLNAKSNSNI